MVSAKRKSGPQDPVLFKTYGRPEKTSHDGISPIAIWEVARAISETPVLFKPLPLDDLWDTKNDSSIDSSFDTECLSEDLYKEAKGNLFPQCQTMNIFSIGPSLWDWYPNREPCDDSRLRRKVELWRLEKDTKFRPKAEHREVKVEYCRLNAYGFRPVQEESEWKDYEGQLKQAQGYLKERATVKKLEWFLRKP